MTWICIRHPEPGNSRQRILPAFLPYHGCPGRCIYCAQHLQTGAGRPTLSEVYQNLARDLEVQALRKQGNLGIAFFGGTFTALSESWQSKFLELARDYREKGVVTHIRCSTRPDRISADRLAWLKSMGLNMVELGVQSFDPDVLHRSQRGYSDQTALAACAKVRHCGLELGIQLMPGLPSATMHSWRNDVAQACAFRPQAVRVYPCLVLQDTPLAEMYQRREFRPWGLARTVWAVGQALLSFWHHGIPVIRMGLAPEPELFPALLAGPWHPALGQMARSLALRGHILNTLGTLPESVRHIFIPNRFAGDFWGHRRELTPAWQRAGLPRNRVHGWDRPYFCIVFHTKCAGQLDSTSGCL